MTYKDEEIAALRREARIDVKSEEGISVGEIF
jgi:hypothetical protein